MTGASACPALHPRHSSMRQITRCASPAINPQGIGHPVRRDGSAGDAVCLQPLRNVAHMLLVNHSYGCQLLVDFQRGEMQFIDILVQLFFQQGGQNRRYLLAGTSGSSTCQTLIHSPGM